MIKMILFGAMVTQLVGCKGYEASSVDGVPVVQSLESISSGFKGNARLGPTCAGSVSQNGVSKCTEPYSGNFYVAACDSTFATCTAPRIFSSDTNGDFQVDAPAGHYMISLPSDPTGIAAPVSSLIPVRVEVVSSSYTSVSLILDNGVFAPSSCPLIQCAAPPPGCQYQAPVAADAQGCAISCGTLSCGS